MIELVILFLVAYIFGLLSAVALGIVVEQRMLDWRDRTQQELEAKLEFDNAANETIRMVA